MAKVIPNRKIELYRLLDEAIQRNQYTREDNETVFAVSVRTLRENLAVPSSYRYADFKHKVLLPLLSKLTVESEISLKLIGESRRDRKIETLQIRILSEERPITSVLDEITMFVNK